MSEIRISGAAEMEKALRQLPDYIAKRVLTGALRKAAQPILEQAQANAPVGEESKGRVRIRTTKRGKIVASNYGKLKLSLKIISVSARKTAHSATVAVTVGKAYWGAFLEFGTRYISPRPFMRPAFESRKMQALNILGAELGKGIESAAIKLAGPINKSGLKRG